MIALEYSPGYMLQVLRQVSRFDHDYNDKRRQKWSKLDNCAVETWLHHWHNAASFGNYQRCFNRSTKLQGACPCAVYHSVRNATQRLMHLISVIPMTGD